MSSLWELYSVGDLIKRIFWGNVKCVRKCGVLRKLMLIRNN